MSSNDEVVEIHYKLTNPKQQEFHGDRYKVFARLVSAGTGAGKTIAGAQEALIWAYENSGSVGYAFEPTYKMVRRNLIPTMEKLLCAPLEAHPFIKKYHRTDSRLVFYNDSQMWMIGLEDPESAEGPNVDWIWSDETRLIRHVDTAWKVWMRRLRGSTPGKHPMGLWLTTTPNAPGSFLHKTFEDPVQRLPNSRVYRWSIDDNLLLPDSYKVEVKRAHVPGTGLYNRFVLGLFANVALGSYAFDSTVHEIQVYPDPGIIRRMVYPVDWGWSNPACILAIGLDGDDRAYVLDEFYQSRASMETLVSAALEMQARWGRGRFVCGHEEPRSIQEFQKAGLSARANKSKRDEGIRELGGRFLVAGDGRPRIYVHRSCVNWISEVQVYDADVKQGDHAMDATRYGLCSVKSGKMTVSTGKKPW